MLAAIVSTVIITTIIRIEISGSNFIYARDEEIELRGSSVWSCSWFLTEPAV